MFPWNLFKKSCLASFAAHHVIEPSAGASVRVADNLAAFANEMRTSYRAMIPSAGKPDEVDRVLAVDVPAPDSARKIPVRIYHPGGPQAEATLPTVLFVHGGGFVSGDLDTHDVLVRAIAVRTPALVISVDYRLAPEYPFPAGLEDVYAVLQWAAGNVTEFGGDPRRIVICGDSAGATLSAAAAMLARDRRGPILVGQWLMYPSVSLRTDTPSWAELGPANFPTRELMRNVIASYVPTGTSPYVPLLSPLEGNHAGLPHALVQVGERDPLRDENVAYSDRLNSAGTPASVTVYEGQAHGFIQFFKDKANHSLGERALDEGIRFLRERFA
ncbi:alpha/beta hydrolase [Burkholderia sp. HI2714]|uniref:alpha/beta hydrolase n=1 Tax=Burkholderia sp. HI2714 TaxID=2015359 RepID=UPI00211AE0C2|nr:alpha/beta hydrolase [Burkholderia sp. HI2714]